MMGGLLTIVDARDSRHVGHSWQSGQVETLTRLCGVNQTGGKTTAPILFLTLLSFALLPFLTGLSAGHPELLHHLLHLAELLDQTIDITNLGA